MLQVGKSKVSVSNCMHLYLRRGLRQLYQLQNNNAILAVLWGCPPLTQSIKNVPYDWNWGYTGWSAALHFTPEMTSTCRFIPSNAEGGWLGYCLDVGHLKGWERVARGRIGGREQYFWVGEGGTGGRLTWMGLCTYIISPPPSWPSFSDLHQLNRWHRSEMSHRGGLGSSTDLWVAQGPAANQ